MYFFFPLSQKKGTYCLSEWKYCLLTIHSWIFLEIALGNKTKQNKRTHKNITLPKIQLSFQEKPLALNRVQCLGFCFAEKNSNAFSIPEIPVCWAESVAVTALQFRFSFWLIILPHRFCSWEHSQIPPAFNPSLSKNLFPGNLV